MNKIIDKHMKQIFIFGLIAVISTSIVAQTVDSTEIQDEEPGYEVIDNEEIEIKTDEIVKKGKADTTNFEIGDKKVSIIEEDGETSIVLKDKNKDNEGDDDEIYEDFDLGEGDPETDDEEDEDKKKNYKFRGHWSGLEFGFNNYVNKDLSLNRSPESEFMDLNTGRSWNINFNFAQYSLPIISNNFGLITGMGLEWSNYHFSNMNTIAKIDGGIQSQALPFTSDPKKNRLQTTYLTIPLLLELQLIKGRRKDRIYLAGGVIGGIKLTSNTKIVYYEDGEKRKDKNKGDYYLRPLRYAVTARAGYKLVKVYCNYYLTSLFIEDRGPELYPVAAGLTLSF
jgi:hypothetical protein